MLNTSEYQILEKLHESTNSSVFRAIRKQDGARIVLKVLNEETPSVERRVRFQQEYKLMRKLGAEGVLKAYDLESHQGMKVMVLEDFGGGSLNRLYLSGVLALKDWLSLAIRITDCLDQLHSRHVIHKDINPSNIVWNRATGQLKLIDLGNATELAREMPEARNANQLEGTLAYLSPEQTGRMNRSIDYRTDFYSLGVTFYELLSGRLPFAVNDMLELVHAHIAKTPAPVDQLNPAIPATVGAIIGKLMKKTAEERYQSAAGLKADLETCLHMLNEIGEISPFPLGRQDFSARLQISQKLYNRESQIATLLKAFENAADGRPELLLVAGYSGIGKTALVHEIQRPVAQRRGYFIEGKFQQFKRDIPYAALIQAFTDLMRQILTEDDAVIKRWKDILQQALGNNAQVIIDVIPEVKFIVGPQSAVVNLPPEQTKNRFHHAFRQFVAAVASAEHPLVIFIDDLQWADLPSLQLLSTLMRAQEALHLLLIGAYRDNELTPANPLFIALKDMRQDAAMTRSVTLLPLGLQDIIQLLRDTFQDQAAEVEELARLCLAKTQGNPFFLSRFLETLNDQHMLYRDKESGQWRWNIAGIVEADITDNVVELMLAKLQRLPAATQRVLQGAACLGNVFDLRMLALVCEMPEAGTADLLWHALREEVIVPLNAYYKYADQSFDNQWPRLMPAYRFLHDRVHQAADLLSSESEKAAMHLAIGRLWHKLLPPAEQQERLFDLANHLNLGQALMTDRDERLELAKLNLAAARKAKASTAYKPALMHLQTALQLVGQADWEREYELMYALHLEAAEMAYLTVDYVQMERYVETALQHVTGLLDRVTIYDIPIRAYISQSKLQEAVALGLQALSLLGIEYPKRPKRFHILWEAVRTKWAMRKNTPESMVHLPVMKDQHALAARRIMSRINATFHRVMPANFAITNYKALRMAVKYGIEPTAAITYASYGVLLGSLRQKPLLGMKYGELGLTVLDRYGEHATYFRGRTMMIVHGFLRPWTVPLHKTVEPLIQAYLQSMEMGDPEFAAHTANLICTHAFHCGTELAEVEKMTAGYCRAVEQMHGQFYRQRIFWKHLQDLQGRSGADGTSEEVMSAQQESMSVELMKKDPSETGRIHCLKLMVSYLLYDYEAALNHAKMVEQAINSQHGLFIVAIYYFYGALANLALLDTAAGSDRSRMLGRARQNLKKLRQWEKNAPANFSNKCALIEAEIFRCEGKVLQAIAAYERAIQQAAEHDILHEGALAKELAGASYINLGQMRNARAHLQEARHDYQLWGALAKVSQLEQRYPDCFQKTNAVKSHAFSAGLPTQNLSTTTTTAHLADKLDFTTVMKASQALSQEIVLEKLLKRLMQVVIENAGAQRGILLLKKDQRWMLEAEKTEQQAEASVLQSMPLDDTDVADALLPQSLVQYVTRTRESMVVADATQDKLLKQDPYVQRHQPRSILCLPILLQSDITGILYLENKALSGAFTEDRLEVLHLLASQAAISIENARLYANMEERVAARTAELALSVKTLNQTQTELLIRNEELAQVNKLQEEQQSELTRFLAVASHDLRQPMHSLNLYLGALSNFDMPEPARPVLSNVRQCAQIMDDMFLALLDLSRLDAQVVAPHIERFPLAALLESIAVEFAPQAKAKGLRLRVAPCSAWVESDPALVEQILRNLTANAVRYTEAGGIVIGCRRRGNRLRLAVVDSGIGISPDQQKSVFEEFCQIGNASRDRTKGLGLGLAIVRRLARLLSIPITLESAPGKGSMFAIDLKRTEALPTEQLKRLHSRAQVAEPDSHATVLAGKLIVVVDDEESALDAMRVLLEQWGCEVVTAVSAADVHAKLADSLRVPDALVCDYQLRLNENGLDVVKALHDEFNYAIPAMMVTGTILSARMQEMAASGLPVLHKPVGAPALRESLERLLGAG